MGHATFCGYFFWASIKLSISIYAYKVSLASRPLVAYVAVAAIFSVSSTAPSTTHDPTDSVRTSGEEFTREDGMLLGCTAMSRRLLLGGGKVTQCDACDVALMHE
jgi:hypothetical protein